MESMRYRHFQIRLLSIVLALVLLSSRIAAYSHFSYVEPTQNHLLDLYQVTIEALNEPSAFCETKSLAELFPPDEEEDRSYLHPPFDPASPFSDAVPEGVNEDKNKLSELFPPNGNLLLPYPNHPPDDSYARGLFSDAIPEGVAKDVFIPPEHPAYTG